MDILPQLLVNALITGSVYALASSGLSLVYGLLRVLNFAHGHILMSGAYCFYWANNILGFNVTESALVSVVVIAILAFLSFRIFVDPFLRFNPILVFVTTLALSTMLESAVSMTFGVNVKSLDAGEMANSLNYGSIFITPIQIIIVLSAFILLAFIAWIIHSTIIGRFIRALSENTPAGISVGVDHRIIYYGVFIVGSLLAAYAGVMVAYETNLQPLMGNAYTIKAFAAMILGGLGNFWGTIIASFILGLTENLSIGVDFLGYSLPAGYKDAFAFVIILLVLLIRPQGLFGSKLRRA